MLHQPSKYHTNPLSHFLALHSNAKNSINSANNSHIELDNSNSTSLDVVNENIGKSFTIAAILGLKQSAAAMEQSNNKDFADVINLSLNQQQLNKVNLNNNYPNDNRFLNHGANMVRLSAPLSHNFNTLVHQTAMSHHASNANSALQSLQQLHHQQSAQNNSGNTGNREKCRIGKEHVTIDILKIIGLLGFKLFRFIVIKEIFYEKQESPYDFYTRTVRTT